MRRSTPFVTALLVGGSLALGGALPAQQPSPKAALQAEIRASQERKQSALRTFLDRERPRAERVAAGQQLGRVTAPPDVAALLGILRNRQEEDAIRALALEAIPSNAGPEALEETIAITTDPANGGEVLKEAAVARLQIFAQFSRQGIDREPRIVEALRTAVRSEVPEIRDGAMGFLAGRNDPVAVQVLEQSLRQPENAPFSKADAIAYLSSNDPRDHFGAIRPHLRDAEPETRIAAIMALSADPVSRPEIVGLAQRPGDVKVREAALQSLSVNDREFPTYAVRLAENAQEDPKVRSVAVLELNKVLNRNQATPEQEQRITASLRSLVQEERQPLEVRSAALESLSVHDEGFGAILREIAQDPSDPLRQRALQALESERETPRHDPP